MAFVRKANDSCFASYMVSMVLMTHVEVSPIRSGDAICRVPVQEGIAQIVNAYLSRPFD